MDEKRRLLVGKKLVVDHWIGVERENVLIVEIVLNDNLCMTNPFLYFFVYFAPRGCLRIIISGIKTADDE